jgi:hypothetical protein
MCVTGVAAVAKGCLCVLCVPPMMKRLEVFFLLDMDEFF